MKETSCPCGIRFILLYFIILKLFNEITKIRPQMRITNAVDAQPYEWPWFVLISKRGKSGTWRHVCGASLIDESHADSGSKLTL